MDSGLKFWRSILPDQVTTGDPGEGDVRSRIDRFQKKLVDSGYSSEEAGSIARSAARRADRRDK